MGFVARKGAVWPSLLNRARLPFFRSPSRIPFEHSPRFATAPGPEPPIAPETVQSLRGFLKESSPPLSGPLQKKTPATSFKLCALKHASHGANLCSGLGGWSVDRLGSLPIRSRPSIVAPWTSALRLWRISLDPEGLACTSLRSRADVESSTWNCISSGQVVRLPKGCRP
jgi:hypothetical protein